ncbi:MAG: undecaprenyldiphospho-muramoylpentapeptide beta-N-acetylglucosaminyltransferase [Fusobacteria bacterium]|nr:undecaprenyldiphospho-muramoylpentapeptide beta-N-acetylglucosaminyltransferase [Fusobacteriota bacterium]
MRKVILTTGGTGGHIYPAITLAKKLIEHDCEVLFVGTKHRMEKEIVPGENFNFIGLDILSGKSIKSIYKMVVAIIDSLKILKKENPDAIIGFGNYISVPMIVAGLLKRKKIYLHEQNVKMGFANNFFYHFSNKLFVSFEETFNNIPIKYQPKVIVTGNPIREDFYNVRKKQEREKLKLKQNEKMLLVVGGSLGAKSINDAILSKWEKIFNEKNIRLYWATGKNNYSEISKKITKIKQEDVVKPYFENIAELMAASDLLISRGGASTISEIIQLLKPSIIIPYNYVGQYDNARVLEENGGTKIFEDKDAENAFDFMFNIINDDKKLEIMSSNMKKMKKGNAAERMLRELDIWRNEK